jgi:hypothetical protein
MRSTDLHPCIYSRLWLFQNRTAASGTEAESICLFRTSLSFRVVQNIVPLLVFEFGHNLNFWVLSQFEFLEFCHNLSFWVSSQFVFLSFIIIWIFEFCHNLSFWVLSKFEFLSLVTIWVLKFCHNLSFWVVTIWVLSFFQKKKKYWMFLWLLWLLSLLSLTIVTTVTTLA